MFLIIDEKFVVLAQWAIRQIELYTKMSRKDTVKLILSIFFYTLLAFALGVIIKPILELLRDENVSIMIVIHFFNVQSFYYNGKEYKKIVESMKEVTDTLPIEIETRKFVRITFLILFIILNLIILSVMLFFSGVVLSQTNESDSFVKNLHLLLFPIVGVILVLEYVLCTRSLPPGEKERIKMEKETQNMNLVKL